LKTLTALLLPVRVYRFRVGAVCVHPSVCTRHLSQKVDGEALGPGNQPVPSFRLDAADRHRQDAAKGAVNDKDAVASDGNRSVSLRPRAHHSTRCSGHVTARFRARAACIPHRGQFVTARRAGWRSHCHLPRRQSSDRIRAFRRLRQRSRGRRNDGREPRRTRGRRGINPATSGYDE
jgi:hypothetical protein